MDSIAIWPRAVYRVKGVYLGSVWPQPGLAAYLLAIDSAPPGHVLVVARPQSHQ